MLNIARNGEQLASELIQTRGESGAAIVTRMGFSPAVAQGVRGLDEHWNGKGRPARLQGEHIPLTSRIALLAQVAEIFHAMGGPVAAFTEIRHRTGTWFDPAVAAAFRLAAMDEAFWPGLATQGLQQRVSAIEPIARAVVIDEDRLDIIATAFADIIDAKSAFTAGHSRRVAHYADGIAARIGLAEPRRRWLRRACLLHDIGQLGVSTGVLDKPGRLDPQESAAMQRHAELSHDILSGMAAFRDIAAIAAAHHERLDGKGYPKALSGEAIALETRIITTADIFDAITAQRPYRNPMPVAEALALMEQDRGTALDGRCLDALRASLPALMTVPPAT